MITIEGKKLHDLIVLKDSIVAEGRAKSKEIDGINIKIKRLENKEKRITSKVKPPKELTDKGDAIVKQVTKLNVELTKIANAINESKLEAIPKEMKDEHMQLMKDREVLERDRNKLALKVQKIKDKVVPVIQKKVKPLLEKYDDIETARAKDGKVEISTFNHLEEFKKKF